MRSAIHITVIFSCLLAWVMIRPRLYPALSIYIPTTCWLSRCGKLALVQRRLLRPQYSSLSEINKNNLAQLRAAWVFHAHNSSRLEVTPVVANGMMFVTASNDAFALDARSGRVVWHHSRRMRRD